MKNRKGFVLVETLVVTVFVMTVLTMLLVNYSPALSEFERREYSDDVDSKYDLYWVKKMVQNDVMLTKTHWTNDITKQLYTYPSGCNLNNPCDNTFWQLKKGDFVSTYQQSFIDLCKNIGVAKEGSNYLIYLTKYHLSKNVKTKAYYGRDDITIGGFFKDWLLKEGSEYGRGKDSGLVEYVAHLPDYVNFSMNTGAEYRLIAKFERKIDPNLDTTVNNIYYTYATIEVIRE